MNYGFPATSRLYGGGPLDVDAYDKSRVERITVAELEEGDTLIHLGGELLAFPHWLTVVRTRGDGRRYMQACGRFAVAPPDVPAVRVHPIWVLERSGDGIHGTYGNRAKAMRELRRAMKEYDMAGCEVQLHGSGGGALVEHDDGTWLEVSPHFLTAADDANEG